MVTRGSPTPLLRVRVLLPLPESIWLIQVLFCCVKPRYLLGSGASVSFAQYLHWILETSVTLQTHICPLNAFAVFVCRVAIFTCSIRIRFSTYAASSWIHFILIGIITTRSNKQQHNHAKNQADSPQQRSICLLCAFRFHVHFYSSWCFFNSVSLRISSSNTSLFPSSAKISRSVLPPKLYSSAHALISDFSIRFSAYSLDSHNSNVPWKSVSNSSALNGQQSPPSECSFQFDSVNMAWVHRLPPFIDTSILPSPQKSQVFSWRIIYFWHF